ncbi:type I polyketide synthase [Streptomyces sp. NRRL S-15]|uniref:type I polyketide synthase n=1 Tax=Streptomyces sp. NRRL S-15 TaxID=1463886 RepID=UPI003B6360EA
MAQNRRAAGHTALSLAWGPSEAYDGDTGTATPAGVGRLSPHDCRAMFDAARTVDHAVLVPMRLDSATLHTDEVPAPLRGVIEVTSRAAAPDEAGSAALREQLLSVPDNERGRVLLELVRAHAARVLDLPEGATVGADKAFKELGFTSVAAVALRGTLTGATGLRLSATVAFDHPTPVALARHLRALLLDDAPAVTPSTPSAAASDEPVAIVAMGCRLPGGISSPEELWQLVALGLDGVTAFPEDRGWDVAGLYDPDPDRQGTTYVREGGFLADAGDFDADFFGISPREALSMDPQQRLLLETSWEVFERAGIDPTSLRGQNVGVFSGLMHHDYGTDAPAGAEGYIGTGTAGSVASGRVAYTLGLEGPAITVDTACSSSLVAMHLAAQALRSGECSMALAGGAAVMAEPGSFIEFSRQRALAPDSRCKAFAAAADGTSWSEGVGVLLLERLSDAQRNGHRVLALLRGSAVNQDGASNGLTAPSGPAQRRVIRQALANARLEGHEVDAVEAHGTGTTLGDPIEAQALLATYGQDRPADRPLWLGSLKSNIGHAQAAAGVAGVIKMVMAMRHGVLPVTLHVDAPTPHVDWASGAVELLTEARDWPDGGRPRRSAVSSFGVSGTNAHVILEHVPEAARGSEREKDGGGGHGPLPLLVSGRGEQALAAQAARLGEHLATRPELGLGEVAHALATTRAALEQRAVVVADDLDEARSALDAAAAGRPDKSVVRGSADTEGKVVFVLPGQGSQWAGMGAELLDVSPVFAQHMALCAEALAPHVDWSLSDVVRQVPGAPTLDRVDVVQPVSFAVMVSLAQVWRSHGVEPDGVVGHSQGEIAAACIAGALSLPDAARVVALRSRAIAQHLAGRGGMMSVALSAEEAGRWLDGAPYGEELSLAAVNGPSSVVVAGTPEALDAMSDGLQSEDVRVRRIPVDYASHSAQVERIEADLASALAPIGPRRSDIPFYSTVHNRWMDTRELDADYWYRNLRGTVRMEEAIRALLAQGFGFFVEVSSHPVLVPAVQATAEDEVGGAVTVVGTLRRDDGGTRRLLTSLAGAWVRGLAVDWPTASPRPGADLPTYAFQRRRFWLEGSSDRSAHASGTPADPMEASFWKAVDSEDLEGLAASLAAGGQGDADGLGAVAGALPVLAEWRRRHRERSAGEAWRYRVTWKRLDGADRDELPGRWLVMTPTAPDGPHGGTSSDGPGDRTSPTVRDDRAAGVLDGLRARGSVCVRMDVNAADADAGELAARIREEAAQPGGISGVLSLLAFDERPVAGAPAHTAGLAATVALVAALEASGVDAPLWALTCGAVATGPDSPETSPAQAMVWGLGRVVALEQPHRWGGLVDLPHTLDERALRRLAGALSGTDGEDQLAVRPTGVFARRLTPAPTGGAPAARRWNPRGTVLVTGGTGGVGAEIARRLASDGAAHLVLTGRRGPHAPGAQQLAEELRASGAQVTLSACDVADRDAVRSLITSLPGRLTAVVHAAGVGQNSLLADTTPEEFAAILAGKAAGAAHLDELLGDAGLDAFVLMSSNSGVWGGGGQSAYAAANAFLDALAERRRARGRTATSVAWGAWGGGIGLGARDGASERLRRAGVREMEPGTAVSALMRAVENDDTCVSVTHMDWQRFGAAFTMSRPSPLIADLPGMRDTRTDEKEEHGTPGPAGRLAGLTGPGGDRLVLDLVRAQSAAVLGHSGAAAVDATRAFRDQGFDSMTALDLRNRLAAEAGLALPSTIVFDHPSPTALATHLRGLLLGEQAVTVQTVPGAARDDDPIVIVAMSARLPGGIASPEDLWKLVEDGGDAVSDFPGDRGWDVENLFDPDPEQTGKSYVRHGSFLYDAGDFDAAFFGISPREALAMDPQQRVLLETAWEVVERAGIDPATLHGSRTGVFVGAMHQDYGTGQSPARRGAEGYFVTGNAASVLSGRVAYTLGLEGPAVTVDTACSSSLVALHMAAQALRSGECDLAMAGGVTVMATPDGFVEFSRQRGLSADGRCRAFAASADGTGWSEGAGLLLVERLSDARRKGHPVLAVVRGTAINQDGASNGLTAPNGTSQQRVIRQALADAGLTAPDVDVVEAHGTGTTLGDPIEAHAVLAAYGQDRPEGRPLWLGSLKSNIGHTQAAAGVAGVIKMVMAMRHLPRTLHVDEPSPHIDWASGAVELLTEARDWPDLDRPRRAGVSSFGISGTNGHVILEQPPVGGPSAPEVRRTPPAVPWLLAARTPEALSAQAARLVAFLERPEGPEPADVAYSLTSRSNLEHRAVLVAGDGEDPLPGLRALAHGEGAAALVQGTRAGGLTAVLFTGQGAQRLGMGRELYDAYPAFAEAFDTVCAELDPRLERPLHSVLLGSDPAPLERTATAQAALFTVEVALFRLMESWGVRPDAVAGHSVGEIAAAHVAGVLSLADACALVAARGALMQTLPTGGSMIAVAASEDEVLPLLAGLEDRVGIAAVNGPSAVVLSGDERAVQEMAAQFAARGTETRRLRVSHAFHSPLMDPMLDPFRAVVEKLRFEAPRIPVVSTSTPEATGSDALCGPDHWIDQVRRPVRFHDAVRTLHSQGVDTFLELGPGGVLTAMVQDCLSDVAETVAAVPTLRRDRPEPQAVVSALAQLHVRGVPVDWAALFEGSGSLRVDLPTYAFQHRAPAAPRHRHAAGQRRCARHRQAVRVHPRLARRPHRGRTGPGAGHRAGGGCRTGRRRGRLPGTRRTRHRDPSRTARPRRRTTAGRRVRSGRDRPPPRGHPLPSCRRGPRRPLDQARGRAAGQGRHRTAARLRRVAAARCRARRLRPLLPLHGGGGLRLRSGLHGPAGRVDPWRGDLRRGRPAQGPRGRRTAVRPPPRAARRGAARRELRCPGRHGAGQAPPAVRVDRCHAARLGRLRPARQGDPGRPGRLRTGGHRHGRPAGDVRRVPGLPPGVRRADARGARDVRPAVPPRLAGPDDPRTPGPGSAAGVRRPHGHAGRRGPCPGEEPAGAGSARRTVLAGRGAARIRTAGGAHPRRVPARQRSGGRRRVGPGACRPVGAPGPHRPRRHRRRRGLPARPAAGRRLGGGAARRPGRPGTGAQAGACALRDTGRGTAAGPGRNRTDHRRHRNPGRTGRPAPRRRARRTQRGAGQPQRRRQHRGPGPRRRTSRTGRPRDVRRLRRRRPGGARGRPRRDPRRTAAHGCRTRRGCAGRRGAHGAHPRASGHRPAAQGRRGMAPARPDQGHGTGRLHAVLVRLRSPRHTRPGQLRGVQRLPGRPGPAPAHPGAARHVPRLGAVGPGIRHDRRPRQCGTGARPARRNGRPEFTRGHGAAGHRAAPGARETDARQARPGGVRHGSGRRTAAAARPDARHA